MNKIFKSVIALFIMAIAAVMIVPNVLADISSANNKGTITVSGIDTTTDSNVDVSIYRLMDVNYDYTNQQPAEPVYTWVSEVVTWVRNNYPTYIGTGTDNSVTDKFNNSLTDKQKAEFYDKLAAAIKNTTGTEGVDKITLNPTDSKKGNCTFTDVAMGNYFVLIENGVRVYKPSAVNVVPKYTNIGTDEEPNYTWTIDNPTVEVKSSKPGVDKKVKVSGGSANATDSLKTTIGSVLEYSIVVDIPNYPDNAIYKNLKISDTLSNGLTFNKDVKVYDVTGVATPTTANLASYTEITAAFASYYTEATNGFAYEFKKTDTSDQYKTAFIDANGDLKYEKILVVYTATVNEKAKIGVDANTNDAKLEYNNNPYTDKNYTPQEDIVKVYTYGIKINKFQEDGKTPLADAEFNILDSEGNVLKFKTATDSTTGKTYYYLDSEGNAVVKSGSDGLIDIRGLAEDTYSIKETKAPEGYVKLQQVFTKTITDKIINGSNPEKAGADGIVDDGTDGYVSQDITNSKGFELPVTGGMGTLLFSVLGIVFMGAAIILIKSIFGNKKVENI